jgi:hypothetical protein
MQFVLTEQQIPLYGVFKLWTSVIAPMFVPTAAEDSGKEAEVSKRQEKMRKRSERGDPKVKAQTRK